MSKVSIAHFNDVYRVTPQKISPHSAATIDVTQFGALLDAVRDGWSEQSDWKKSGLSLFSGDVFSPSVESSVTRGSHMVPILNALGVDVSLTGNHDFDFGYLHLSKLIQDTNFPWLLSNIIDENTNDVPECLRQFQVLERGGVRIGIIGLVEEEWITTVSSWPPNFKYKDMAEVGRALSAILRDPEGQHKCDLIIALTHARIPNDITLAKNLFALSPSAQADSMIASCHGVDILLGGHDHLYYVSRGVTSWEGYDTTHPVLGAENDHGDVLVVKSGTDFRDLSEITLELEDTPDGSVRRKVIKDIRGKRHSTKPDSPSSEKLTQILETILSNVSETLKAPVCITEVELDVRSELIRTKESAVGNWFADVLRHAYDDALCLKGCSGSDGVLICAGTLRGDSVYPPGQLTLGNIMEILPFEDPVVVLELDGQAIWDALEASLSTWPAQEGRFPVISGFRVEWDSRRVPGQRVLGVWLQNEIAEEEHGIRTTKLVDGDAIDREKGGKMYKIVTREYMARGHDGYEPLLGHNYLVDDENGQLMSSLVRKYLLGSRFVNRMAHMSNKNIHHLHCDTADIVSREVIVHKWQRAAGGILQRLRSRAHYRDRINIAANEHMSDVDCFSGDQARQGRKTNEEKGDERDEYLPVIHPVIDNRLRDGGRA
ncbi:Metallo-dependent phosphatase [Leucogyrophana mollusca]|uniref:Metallo-dependent phosphatase n=1 Tax=Leucogyrophana mollusca TaxID=85980 RepID=A0ACB8BSD0_9AGAM|nr:Metallo-dependent phosphatase [Leucogyrophana mollusca]